LNRKKLAELTQQLGRRPRLLIVDDVPSIIIQVRELFRDNCEIFMANDGEKALELAESVLPDVVLLDINLPGINGYSVLKELEASPNTNDIPVIFLTGDSLDLNEEIAFDMGAVDFIRKPLNSKITIARTYTHLVNKIQSDLLQLASKQDGLTKLLNRSGLDDAFERVWLECRRKKVALSVLMIDIDCFKEYNDTYGHLAGDECLKLVASAISNELKRPLDIAARYGGEEFCCLLPEIDLNGAVHVAQLIRESVFNLVIEHLRTMLPIKRVTVSIGVASFIPDHVHEISHLLSYADSLLYKSKESGRNMVSSGYYINKPII